MFGYKKKVLKKFDESVKDCSDLVLVVSGRKFYVSKMFLASQSSNFKAQISTNPEISQIELDAIDPDDFQNFLELLHGEDSLNYWTLEGILNLAVMYDAATALHRCEDYLREKSTKSLGAKLELSAVYGLEDLRRKYLSEIRSSRDLNSIIQGNLENFNAPILKELLQKCIPLFCPQIANQDSKVLGAISGFLNFGLSGWFARYPRARLRNFDNNESGCSDVITVVADQKFYLSKMFLANQSSFFKSLLLGGFSESGQSEVKLNEIDPNDFQCFLELLHGEPSINDSTVEGILKLADMYVSPTALRRCEQFLREESHLPVGKRLEFASMYKMDDLKMACLSEVNNFQRLHIIINNNMEHLDESILRDLLRKSIGFPNHHY